MFHNSAYMWVAPIVAMIVAQVLKPLFIMIQLRRFDLARMRQWGGMPSSHTALVVALVAELWLRYGGRDPILAIGIFIAMVVMYDAAGVRWQTGRQAAVLNRLLHDLKGQHALHPSDSSPILQHAEVEPRRMTPPSTIAKFQVAKVPWWLVDWPILNEHVGHKPTEVIGGMVVGLAVALFLR